MIDFIFGTGHSGFFLFRRGVRCFPSLFCLFIMGFYVVTACAFVRLCAFSASRSVVFGPASYNIYHISGEET